MSSSGKPLVLLVAVTTRPASSGWICTEHTEPSPWQGPEGEAVVEEELGDFCSVLGLGNAPREGTSEVQKSLGAQGWRAVKENGGWCCRTLGLQSSFQGRLLDLGLIFLAGLSPSPFLFSSSNILLLILQDSISQASLMSQAGMVMQIHASLALETTVSAIFNSYGHSLCLLWSRFCAEHWCMFSNPILLTTPILWMKELRLSEGNQCISKGHRMNAFIQNMFIQHPFHARHCFRS